MGSSKKRVELFLQYQKERYPDKPLRRLKRAETNQVVIPCCCSSYSF
jgi:hypothetical protein